VIGFQRLDGTLACDGVPLPALAAAYRTPLYVYSAATIVSRYRAVDEAFASHPHAMHYALKANSTLAIARLLRGLGSAADANSGGEIDVALRAGFIPPQIVFTGWEDARGARTGDLGVKTINAGRIFDGLTRSRAPDARYVRVNPDIDAGVIRTSQAYSKPTSSAFPLTTFGKFAEGCGQARARLVGLHSHVGSQITDLSPLRRAAEALSLRVSFATTASPSSA
jgi:diaminopimelate decarboxylase